MSQPYLSSLDAHAGVSLAMAVSANTTNETAAGVQSSLSSSHSMTLDVSKRIGLGLSLDFQHPDWIRNMPSAQVSAVEENKLSLNITPTLDEVELNAESPTSLYEGGDSPTLLAWALENPIEDTEEEGGFSMRRSYSSLHIIKKEHRPPRTGAAKQPNLCCIVEVDEDTDSDYEWLACTAPVSLVEALEWYTLRQFVEGRYELVLSDAIISYINSTTEEVQVTSSSKDISTLVMDGPRRPTHHMTVNYAPAVDSIVVDYLGDFNFDEGASPSLLAWARDHPVENDAEEVGYPLVGSLLTHFRPKTGAAISPCLSQIIEDEEDEFVDCMSTPEEMTVRRSIQDPHGDIPDYFTQEEVDHAENIILQLRADCTERGVPGLGLMNVPELATMLSVSTLSVPPSTYAPSEFRKFSDDWMGPIPAPEPVMSLPVGMNLRLLFLDLGDWVLDKMARMPRSASWA